MSAHKKILQSYETSTSKYEDILIKSDQVIVEDNDSSDTSLTQTLSILKAQTAGLDSTQSVPEYVQTELEPVQSDVSVLQVTTAQHDTAIENIDNKLSGIATSVTDYVDTASDTLTTKLNTVAGAIHSSISGLDTRIANDESKLSGIGTTVVQHVSTVTNALKDGLESKIETIASDTAVVTVRVDNLEKSRLTGVMLDRVLQPFNTETKTVTLDLSNYATKNDIASVQRYKGTVSYYSDLLAIDNPHLGDTYNVTNAGGTDSKGTPVKAGDNVSFGDTGWDVLAGTTDLTAYLTKLDAKDTYVAKIAGKQLSTNDLTDELVSKIEAQFSGGITAITLDNVTQTVSNNTATLNLSGYVKKETGKQLSQYNFDDTLNNKLNSTSNTASTAVQSIKLDNVVQTVNTGTRQVTLNLSNYATNSAVSANYVAKETGKGLSTEDLTTSLKNRLESTVTDISLDNVTQTKDTNGAVTLDLSNYATNVSVSDNYVAKENGKGLSTEDFTTTYKNKLDEAIVGIDLDGITQVKNNSVVSLDLSNYATQDDIAPLISAETASSSFVAQEPNRQLSTNDLTDELVETIRSTELTANSAIQGVTLDGNSQSISENIVDLNLSDYATKDHVSDNYVSKEDGKELSANDFTDDYRNKLDNAIVRITLDGNDQYKSDSTVELNLSDYATRDHVSDNYVSKDGDKQLSEEDFTSEYKEKLNQAITGVTLDGNLQSVNGDTVDLNLSDYATRDHVSDNYVAKDGDKQLSTEDFTTIHKNNLELLTDSATVGIKIDGQLQTIDNKIATLNLSNYATRDHVSSNYVQKNGNKQLSEEDFTSTYKHKLEHLDPYSLATTYDNVSGTYGPSENTNSTATVTVPQLYIDSHGFTTSANNRVVTINNVANAVSATTATVATQLGRSGNITLGNAYNEDGATNGRGVAIRKSLIINDNSDKPHGELTATTTGIRLESIDPDNTNNYSKIYLDTGLVVHDTNQVDINTLTVSNSVLIRGSATTEYIYLGRSDHSSATRLGWYAGINNYALTVSNTNGSLWMCCSGGIALSTTQRIVAPSLTGTATYANSAASATTATVATSIGKSNNLVAGAPDYNQNYGVTVNRYLQLTNNNNICVGALRGAADVLSIESTDPTNPNAYGAIKLDNNAIVVTSGDNTAIKYLSVKSAMTVSSDLDLVGNLILGNASVPSAVKLTWKLDKSLYVSSVNTDLLLCAPNGTALSTTGKIVAPSFTGTATYANSASSASIATTASSCTGNAATATSATKAGTAASCTGNAATATSATKAGTAATATTAATASGFVTTRTISVVYSTTSGCGTATWDGKSNLTITITPLSNTGITAPSSMDPIFRGKWKTDVNMLGFTETLHGEARRFGNLVLQQMIPYTGWSWLRRCYTNGAWSSWFRYDACRKWDATASAWSLTNSFMNMVSSCNAGTATSATKAGTAASCTGNAATATSATKAGTAASCTGNAATATSATKAGTATTAGSCTGNAATATTATKANSCTGNAATATSATNAGTAATANALGNNATVIVGGMLQTAAGTAAKVVSAATHLTTPTNGLALLVYCKSRNTAANVTMKISGWGSAYNVMYNGAQAGSGCWAAGSVHQFVFWGDTWYMS